MPDVEVAEAGVAGARRATTWCWAAGGGGIDGAHILTPMPYLMTHGHGDAENKPVPMDILARLNTNGQAISVAKELKAAEARRSTPRALKEASPDEGGRQEARSP